MVMEGWKEGRKGKEEKTGRSKMVMEMVCGNGMEGKGRNGEKRW